MAYGMLMKPSRLVRDVSKWERKRRRERASQRAARQAANKWKAISAQVKHRDGGRCRVCGIFTLDGGDPTMIGAAHHIVPMIRRLWRALFPSVPVVTVSTEPEKRVLQSYQAAGARVRFSPGCGEPYSYETAVKAQKRARRRTETGRVLVQPKPPKAPKDNVTPMRKTGTR